MSWRKPAADSGKAVADPGPSSDCTGPLKPAQQGVMNPSREILRRHRYCCASVPRSFPRQENAVTGQGSTGNVIAALCSFFIPGLGQLIQGRLFKAIVQFVLAGVLWFFLLGWIIHLWSILDAATFKPR